MTDAPLESAISRKIVRALNAIDGVKAQKIVTHMSSQLLDILVCARGRMIWLETKRPGKHMTPRQEYTAASWYAAGSVCAEVHSVDEALEVVSKVLA